MASKSELEHTAAVLRERVDTSPDKTTAWIKLGQTYLAMKKPREAVQVLTEACERNPDSGDTARALGAAYVSLGDATAAIASYENALNHLPQDAKILRTLALLWEQQNDLGRAKDYAEAVLSISPDDVAAVVVKARVERRRGRLVDALSLLDAYRPTNGEPKYVAAYWVERGKCLDKLDRFDEAYTSFEKGQQIEIEAHPEVAQYKTNTAKLLLRERQAVQRFKDGTSTYTPSPHFGKSPVFMVGFPRSGTTLLDNVLDAHPALTVTSERSPVDAIQEVLLKSGKDSELNQSGAFDFTEPLRTQYWAHVKSALGYDPKDVYVDKLPLNMVYIRTIHHLFPQAKIIFVLRHPCDVCLSNFMQPFQFNLFMANFLSLEDTVAFYQSCMSLWQLAVDVLPVNIHVVRYEDLLEDFNTTVNNLLSFLGVPWDDAVTNYHHHAAQRSLFTPSYEQVVKPIYQDSRGRWQNYRKQMEPVLPKLSPFIAAFDYPAPNAISSVTP